MEYKIILFVLVLLVAISYANFTSWEKILKINKTELSNHDYQVLESLHKLEQILKTLSKFISESSLPFMIRMFGKVSISSSCIRSGIHFLRDLRQLKGWPFKLLDSCGKTSGILSGTIWIYGDYDQCLNTERETKNSNEIIRGKYCAVKFIIPQTDYSHIKEEYEKTKIYKFFEDMLKPFKVHQFMKNVNFSSEFRFDICIPSQCSQEDLKNVLHWIIPDSNIVHVEFCKVKEEKMEFSTAQYICLTTLGFFIIWVIVGTIVDILFKFHIFPDSTRKGIFLNCLLSVSIYTSTKKLFCNYSYQENTKFFCGMKFTIFCNFIFIHCFSYKITLPTVTANLFNMKYLFGNVRMEIAYQATMMIETFFFISGFLTFYLRKNNIRMPKLQYISFVISRYIRLTLPVLCILAFVIILPLFGDGPHWEFIKNEEKLIEKYWWTFVFHIQNLYYIPSRILGHVWFLAVLMQLNIFTFFLLIIKDRWPRIEIILLSILILTGITSQISVMLIRKVNILLGISINLRSIQDYYSDIYQKPYNIHLSSYCVGLLIGTLLNGKEVKFRKNIRLCFWIISVLLLGFMLFALHDYRSDVAPNETFVFIHQELSPIACNVVISWVTVACLSGNGGMLNKFFSLHVFAVLDRLILWIYLLHPLILFYIFGELRSPQPFTEISLWMLYLIVMFFSIITSILLYIFLEIPLRYLFSKLFSKKSMQKNTLEAEVTKM